MKILRFTSVIVFSFSIFACVANAQTAKNLFTILETPEKAAAPSSLASVRESKVDIDQHISGSEILIPLYDGKTYRAVEKGSEVRGMDDRTWRGKLIEGKFEGDVIITFRKGFVSGLIYAPAAVYEIVARGDSHFLVQLDQSLFPECGGDVKGQPAVSTPTNAPEGGAFDSGDRIDVLVVYTTATKNFLGGDAQAQALAQQAIDATNTAYINSKIRQRVRLVHSQENVYVESGNHSTDLSNLRNSSSIQTLRNTHNADLVAQIEEVSSVCGVGYLMGGTDGNSNNGFTVTARSCAVGNLSFAHELGHNMGSHHNPENGSGATYPYGYGHYVNGVYRTVMSYTDPCPSGCTRRPYFSNPGVVSLGHPTGTASRDNARSINNTADTIANYRFSPTAIQLSNFDAGTNILRGIRRNLTWNAGNVTGNIRIEYSMDEGTTWQTLIASTPDDGSEGVTFWTRPSRMARVRAVSINAPHVSDSSTGNIFIR